ncbi:MAG: site-2 protease family protein [Planctomycetota bacterium]
MELLAGWAGLILGFSGLIFIHELGHFLLAKWNGVKVYVFSIGMGPYIVSFTYNGTVYALSLIPMGGYVKMMGQDDLNADLSGTKNPADFRNKRPGQKAAILVAGAAFNIILTLVLYAGLYWSGMPVQPPLISHVPPDRPLARAVLDSDKTTPAKLKKGDRIEYVNDIPVKSLFDLVLQVTACPVGEPIVLGVLRKGGGGRLEYVRVDMESDKKHGVPNIGLSLGSAYAEDELLPLGFTTEPYIFLKDAPSAVKEIKDGPAGKSGLFKKGDRIIAVENRTNPANPIVMKLEDEYSLPDIAAMSRNQNKAAPAGEARVFIIERNNEKIEVPLTSEYDPKMDTFRFGIAQSMYYRVTQVEETSEAYKAGLRKGDFVLGFRPDDPMVHPWQSGQLEWIKTVDDVKSLNAKLTVPAESTASSNKLIFRQPYMLEETFQKSNVIDALGAGWDDTKRYSMCMFATIRNLFTGSVSAKNLSGPVGIGKNIFKVASKQSFKQYLWFLAFISLNLGVMQLLPIPLLDGFHLVIVFVEKLKGSAVNAKIQEAFLYVGLAMIGSLLVYVMWNDISSFFHG